MPADITTPGAQGQTVDSAEKDLHVKKKLTNDTVKNSNIEQQLLTRNLNKAVGYFIANKDLFNYRTFRQMEGNGAQIINKLRGIDDLEAFYRIKPSVLSLLRPKVRIFKVNHEEVVDDESGLPDQKKLVALRQPCYKEFKFSDNFGAETAASAQEYLKYESTKPNWRNVGLKSFDFTYNGKTSAALQNDLTCKLVLTFKGLKDLQASPPGEPPPEKGGLRYADLVTWPLGSQGAQGEGDTSGHKHYQIKVMLGYTQPTREQLRGLNLTETEIDTISNIEKLNSILSLNLQDYEFDIKENGQVVLTMEYRGSMEILLASNAVNIFQNSFRVQEGGAITISKKIKAEHNISNVIRLMTDLQAIANNLADPGCKDETCKERKLLRNLVEADKMFATVLKEGFMTAGKLDRRTGLFIDGKGDIKIKGSGNLMYSFFRTTENMKKIVALVKRKVGLYEKDVYKSFVDQLIVGNDESPLAPGTRLFCMNAGEKEVEKALGIILADTDQTPGAEVSKVETSTVEQSTTTAVAKGDSGVKIDRCHLVNPINPTVRNEAAQEITAALEAESSSREPGADRGQADPGRASVRDFSEKNYKFYFVYLGDIIELACKNAGVAKLNLESDSNLRNEGFSIFNEESYFPEDENNTALGYPLKNTRILLGPIEYKDVDNRVKRINLAQFPISFNSFRSWFLNKVIRPRRANMSLAKFISLLLSDLVMPSLSAEMSENFKAPDTTMNVVSLSLPGKQVKSGGIEYRACGRSLGNFKEALPMRQTLDVNSSYFKENYSSVLSGISQESSIKTSFDYLLIQTTTANVGVSDRKGDALEDSKVGIYHFNIGSDVGLLKNMKFTKSMVRPLKDMLIIESLEKNDSLQQLRIPFNTDLVLVGNPLFIPGMFYYVNPTLTGLGRLEDPSSLANRMFLGGYHSVNMVTTTVTSDKYETIINGTQLGIFGVR